MSVVKEIIETTAKAMNIKMEFIPEDKDIPATVAKKAYQQNEWPSVSKGLIFIGSGEDVGSAFQDCEC